MKLVSIVVVDTPIILDIVGCIRHVSPIRENKLEAVFLDALVSTAIQAIFKSVSVEPTNVDYDMIEDCYIGTFNDVFVKLSDGMDMASVDRLIELVNTLKEDLTEVILVDSYLPNTLIESSVLRNTILTIQMYDVHPCTKIENSIVS